MILNLLDDNQYCKEETTKNQIVVHHTAGGSSAINVIHGWNFNIERIGTAFVIDGSGKVYCAFDPKYWAYHIGLKTSMNESLNKHSIGIELCNWGQLIKKPDGKFYNYVNKVVPESEVVTLPKFRGFEYYHKYNDLQLSALKDLINDLCSRYSIPKTFNVNIFEVNQNALKGVPGIYTHVSYRTDKNDCSPQPELIRTLNTL